MKTQFRFIVATLSIVAFVQTGVAQGNAFTYQGVLNQNGAPVNGAHDLTFTLYTAPSGGIAAGTTNFNDLVISNGLFTVTLDFGEIPFIGADRWLEIAVRPGASTGAYTILTPRQPINPTPYAIFSRGVNSAGIIGQITDSQLSTTFGFARTFSNPGNQFFGDGANLTSLNASQLTSGAVPDARLSANVALRNGGNAFSGNQSISGNVGIGTTSPASRLHVAFANDTELSLESLTPGGRRWTLQSTHGSPAFGNATFQIIDRTAGAARLNITTNGDVGIGIGNAVPSSRLQVSGTVTATSFSGDGSGLSLSANVALRTGGNAFSGNQIITNGNIGIGTTSPADLLHVAGQFTRARVESTDNSYAGYIARNSRAEWFNGIAGGNGAWEIFQNSPSVGSRLVVTTNGNVGIGNPSPIANFHVRALQYGALPTALFEVQNCGAACAQQNYQENIRLLNSNPNGQSGIGFLTAESSTLNTVPAAWIGTDYGSGANNLKFATQTGGALTDRVYINGGTGNVGIGTNSPATKLHVAGEITTVAVNITSDRNAKEQFKPVNAREVLDKVTRLPISEWQFKDHADARHIGPMAQDFHAAFAVGRDEKHITTVDADGVALAAIQGLNEKLEEKTQEVDALKKSVAALTELVNKLAAQQNGGAR